MSDDVPLDITALLARWKDGDREAESALFRQVYLPLRNIANARLRGSSLTLSATELAHETYARLCSGATIDYRDRSHFFSVAARATRHFVVDYLRTRDNDKHGGGKQSIALDASSEAAAYDDINLNVDWVAVHDALSVLETVDSESARVVELKFFSGLTTDEIAEAVGVSRATVVRDWRFAKAWLADRLGAGY